eukprot:COSAG01_NODE_4665_length_4837_cov_1.976361_7_plen_189_part_00
MMILRGQYLANLASMRASTSAMATALEEPPTEGSVVASAGGSAFLGVDLPAFTMHIAKAITVTGPAGINLPPKRQRTPMIPPRSRDARDLTHFEAAKLTTRPEPTPAMREGSDFALRNPAKPPALSMSPYSASSVDGAVTIGISEGVGRGSSRSQPGPVMHGPEHPEPAGNREPGTAAGGQPASPSCW